MTRKSMISCSNETREVEISLVESSSRTLYVFRSIHDRLAGTDCYHTAHLRRHRRLRTLRRADPRHRWEPLRDNVFGRGQ